MEEDFRYFLICSCYLFYPFFSPSCRGMLKNIKSPNLIDSTKLFQMMMKLVGQIQTLLTWVNEVQAVVVVIFILFFAQNTQYIIECLSWLKKS